MSIVPADTYAGKNKENLGLDFEDCLVVGQPEQVENLSLEGGRSQCPGPFPAARGLLVPECLAITSPTFSY